MKSPVKCNKCFLDHPLFLSSLFLSLNIVLLESKAESLMAGSIGPARTAREQGQ